MRGTSWKTSDADDVRVGNTYHTFVDRTVFDHPDYKIAWASNKDPSEFAFHEEPTTGSLSSDSCVRYIQKQQRFVMYQEFFDDDRTGGV